MRRTDMSILVGFRVRVQRRELRPERLFLRRQRALRLGDFGRVRRLGDLLDQVVHGAHRRVRRPEFGVVRRRLRPGLDALRHTVVDHRTRFQNKN